VFSQRVYDLYAGLVPEGLQERPGRPGPRAGSYSDPSVAGGGQGHTQASHVIGALLWLTGLVPREVFAFMDNRELALDVVDALTIRFDGGALGTVMANGLVPRGARSMGVEVQGDGGILSVDVARGTAELRAAGEAQPLEFGDSAAPQAEHIAAVPRNFVRAILSGEELHLGPEVAVHEVEILDAAYRSAETGRAVQIPRETH